MVLGAALGMVAGIRLVGCQPQELRRGERKIDVDGDAAAQAAEVCTERQPWLVAHDRYESSLVLWQLDQAARPRTRLRDEASECALDQMRWHDDRGAPPRVTLSQRRVTGQQLRE